MASQTPTAMEWMILLGHMASLIHLISGACLRMRSLQLNLNSQPQEDTTCVVWTPDLLQDLQLWAQKHFLPVRLSERDLQISCDTQTLQQRDVAALSCNTLQVGCGPRKKRLLTSTSWS